MEQDSPDAQPLAVTAAIIEANGRVLIARRGEGGARGGRWEFPGGKVGKGESDVAALEREIREELGVTVSVGRLTDRVDWSYPDARIELRAYACSILAGEPTAIEHAEIRWVRPEDLTDYDLCEADVPIARRLSERYAG